MAHWSGFMNIALVLSKAIGKKKVFDSRAVCRMYAYDSSPFMKEPDTVVFPESTSDVSEIVKIAFRENIPVVPRGAGTCLSGGAVPVKGGISLVMTRMNSILEIDSFSRTALVEPGVVNLDLQKALSLHHLFFPPDPASQKVATIGGNVAECAGGIQGVRYGVTKNYVLGLELVLNDGSVARTGMLSPEECFGPDSTGLFNGSEGAFAVITKILVRCIPCAESVRTALAAFPSVGDAASAVSGIIRQGIVPTALELMDKTLLKAVDDFLGIGFPPDAEAVLLLEVDGYEIDLDRQLEIMAKICRENGSWDIKKAKTREERERLWKARRSGNGALGRIKPAYVVHDVTVPRDQVALLLTSIQEIGKKHGIIIAQMAHAGDGNAHPHLLYDPSEDKIQEKLHQVTQEIFKTALALGGTISGEHGIGLEKKAYMPLQFSEPTLRFMSELKKIMDPTGILNPGKVLPGKPEGSTQFEVNPDQGCLQEDGFSHIDSGGRILSFLPENLTIQVDGRTPLKILLEQAAGIHAFLPLCPYTQGDLSMAHLVETGAWGYSAMAYGSLREYIYGMEFTGPSGELIQTGGHTAKNVAGFDLTRLFWGAGNACGEIKNLTFKLLPCPEKEIFMVKAYPCFQESMQTIKAVFQTRACICTLKTAGTASGWEVIVGLSGSERCVNAHAGIIKSMLEKGKGKLAIYENEGIGDFFIQDTKDRKNYPGKMLNGRGQRSSMFIFIDKYQDHLSNPGPCRIEMDIGTPEISISSSDSCQNDQNGSMAYRDEPGFYLQTSEKNRISGIYSRFRRMWS